jgi:hypothetical protein
VAIWHYITKSQKYISYYRFVIVFSMLVFVSVTELADKLGVSGARVRKLVIEGRIKGAFKVGNSWVIPLVNGMPQLIDGSRGPKFSFTVDSQENSSPSRHKKS